MTPWDENGLAQKHIYRGKEAGECIQFVPPFTFDPLSNSLHIPAMHFTKTTK